MEITQLRTECEALRADVATAQQRGARAHGQVAELTREVARLTALLTTSMEEVERLTVMLEESCDMYDAAAARARTRPAVEQQEDGVC